MNTRFRFSLVLSIHLVTLGAVAAGLRADAIFVGATTPDVNGARGWFDHEVVGSCGPGHEIHQNNWSQQWCDTMPPVSTGPVGTAVDLNGYSVTAFIDTSAASLLNPAGGLFQTGGIATHQWGVFTNSGQTNNGRVVSTTGIVNTHIINNGAWFDIGGGLGTDFGNVTFDNHGMLADVNPSASLYWSKTGNPMYPGPNIVHNFDDGIISISTANTGHLNGLTLINEGVFETAAHGNINIATCDVTSDADARWNTLAGDLNLGFGFENCTMRGVFNGNAANTGSFRLQSTVTFDDDTTLNLTGDGAYRWVLSSLTVNPGKTLTNAGVFHTLNSAQLTGSFVNDGSWFDEGSTSLMNATIVNNGSYKRNVAGAIEPSLGSSLHRFTNNGTMESINGAQQGIFGAVRFENNGTISNSSTSRILFQGSTIASAPTASWKVQNGSGTAGFEFVDVSLSGTFKGKTPDADEWRINQSMNVVDDTTFSVTGGGISRWVANGPCTIAPGKTLTNTGVFNHLNGWNVSGKIVNDGEWNLINGGTTFNNHTFVNNGTIKWNAHDFGQQSGSSGNLFTNNGSAIITAGTRSFITLPVMNNGLIEIGSGAEWGSDFLSLTQGPSGVVDLKDGAARLVLPPSGVTVSGGTIKGMGAVQTSFFSPINLDGVTLVGGDPAFPGQNLMLYCAATLSNSCKVRPYIVNASTINGVASNVAIHVDGALEVSFNPNVKFSVGQHFSVVAGASLTGQFSSVQAVGGAPYDIHAVYSSTNVEIVIDAVRRPPSGNGNVNGNSNANDNTNGNVRSTDNRNANEVPDGESPAPQASPFCGADAMSAGMLTLAPLMLAGSGLRQRRRRQS